ncbi:ExeA family protein [Parahaliea aestuarii]|uniref:AAA family ATPase n=1 Tax=Parahaliea aestuarii TaxID=1852021 RepID=A0A5C8ZMI2_9GAMM|nr:AAA family ATPase [Parahaliea aestuarii]TXS89658.1 AAA family ATPase [Parahaliea aestuarii]
MYERHFNFTAEPFRLSPDHHFRYEHAAYAKARAYMTYAYMRAEGFAMITGRPGTGKTTLIGDLIDGLADESVTTANLVCTQLEANDLLKMVAYSFGISTSVVEKGELLQGLTELLHRWNREQRRALLIVDEAQDLSLTAMEELRLLTNIQSKGQPLLQVFLLGQPELRELVLRPEMEQVHQRIVAASHLTALQADETEAYIRHRLEQVGWQNDPAISRSVYPLIHKFSEGVPRRINLICSRLLLHCLVEQKHALGSAEVKEVIRELQSEHLAAGRQFNDSDFAVEDEFDEPVPIPDSSPVTAPASAQHESGMASELEGAQPALTSPPSEEAAVAPELLVVPLKKKPV